ncbi:MAG TPA: cell division protein FtsZ [Patescibacteria group bacterium]|nr:cell division protein FtsZ [Patescibacteria group bacterium]
MAEVKPAAETFAKIKVIGVGGGGGAAINRMIEKGIQGVEFVAMNTDVQALHYNKAKEKLHIGKAVTKGLGAGMNSDLGKQAAEETQNEIREIIKGCDMVFVTCGLGGGTGTGAAPIVAQIARDLGALTVAVVTKPFGFEGGQRQNLANRGLAELADKVDTIITISNDKLLQVIDKKASLLDAFVIADDVLRQGVQGIAEIITVPGIVNADFADVKAVMSNAGSALMGIGESSGENKAVEAAKDAINSKLLDMSIEGARGIVFTITGGPSLGMNEVNEAAKVITSAADEEAKIIFGAVIDEKLKDEIKITVVATGFDGQGESLKKTGFEKSYSPTSFMRKNEEKKDTSLDERKNKAWSLGSNDETKIEGDDNKVKENDFSIQKPKVEPKKQEKNLTEDDEDDELSVPAFIRKKMK